MVLGISSAIAVLELAAAFAQFNGLATFRFSRRLSRRGFLLSDHELATIWHPAIASVQTPQMARTEYRRLEPPTNLRLKKRERAGECLTELGTITYQDRGDVFGLDLASRLRHLALIGKTGTGKTTLLENLIASDIRAGRGVALIDPHGDLAERVLLSVPKDRTNDVIYFDAGDTLHPLAFNPLALRSPEQRSLVASGVVSVFKKQHADSWGPRLENLLRFTTLALLEVEGT
ncbi:MAG: DUF87 domain-containing protein, partial [Gemmatimonadetes bacterium]|nr:DUF87 domain-containing protein [Gemmatimonadota bacterium]